MNTFLSPAMANKGVKFFYVSTTGVSPLTPMTPHEHFSGTGHGAGSGHGTGPLGTIPSRERAQFSCRKTQICESGACIVCIIERRSASLSDLGTVNDSDKDAREIP